MFVRFTQKFGYIRLSLCRRHLQSFMSVTQKLFGSTLGAQKCAIMSYPVLQDFLDNVWFSDEAHFVVRYVDISCCEVM